MLPFKNEIIDLLIDYKSIIKKHLSPKEWAVKVERFGLKRKILRQEEVLTLYRKATTIRNELADHLRADKSEAWYSGLDEFYQHLKNSLEQYQIENNELVHSSQLASRAMVDAFQYMNLPEAHRNEHIAHKLDMCGHLIAKYGNRDQQALFSKALKKFQHHDVNFFMPLIHSFENYLRSFALFFRGQDLDPET